MISNYRFSERSHDFEQLFILANRESEQTLSTQESAAGTLCSAVFTDSLTQYVYTESNDENMVSPQNLNYTWRRDIDTDQRLLETFRVFDRDGDGFISPVELRYVMNMLGESMTDEEAEDMVREVDFDRDGKISYQEFIRIMDE